MAAGRRPGDYAARIDGSRAWQREGRFRHRLGTICPWLLIPRGWPPTTFSAEECGRVSSENERGWTARLTYDDEVVVYCPECDERESGRIAD